MPSVGILLLLMAGGLVMCVKARAAGPAAACAALAVLFLVSTPVGSGLPGALSSMFSAVDSATTPALNHDPSTTASTPKVSTTAGMRR